MAENFPNRETNLFIQVHEPQKLPQNFIESSSPRLVIIKLRSKTKNCKSNKEKIHSYTREPLLGKGQSNFQENPFRPGENPWSIQTAKRKKVATKGILHSQAIHQNW